MEMTKSEKRAKSAAMAENKVYLARAGGIGIPAEGFDEIEYYRDEGPQYLFDSYRIRIFFPSGDHFDLRGGDAGLIDRLPRDPKNWTEDYFLDLFKIAKNLRNFDKVAEEETNQAKEVSPSGEPYSTMKSRPNDIPQKVDGVPSIWVCAWRNEKGFMVRDEARIAQSEAARLASFRAEVRAFISGNIPFHDDAK